MFVEDFCIKFDSLWHHHAFSGRNYWESSAEQAEVYPLPVATAQCWAVWPQGFHHHAQQDHQLLWRHPAQCASCPLTGGWTWLGCSVILWNAAGLLSGRFFVSQMKNWSWICNSGSAYIGLLLETWLHLFSLSINLVNCFLKLSVVFTLITWPPSLVYSSNCVCRPFLVLVFTVFWWMLHRVTTLIPILLLWYFTCITCCIIFCHLSSLK